MDIGDSSAEVLCMLALDGCGESRNELDYFPSVICSELLRAAQSCSDGGLLAIDELPVLKALMPLSNEWVSK